MIRSTGGTVINGVIVPDDPLPDNTYVVIAVANAPREVFERLQRRPMFSPPTNMSASQHDGVRLVIDPDVALVLQYHNAESAFARRLDAIRSFFPEAREFMVYLEEELYEAAWIRIRIQVLLPAGYSDDCLYQQRLSYWTSFRGTLPPDIDMLFYDDFEIHASSDGSGSPLNPDPT